MSKKEKNTQTTGRKTISKKQDIITRFCKNKNAVVGMVIAFIFVCIAVFAPLLVDYDTQVLGQDIYNRIALPGGDHLLGTDELGRDVLARLIYGARVSLLIGVLTVTVAMVCAIVIGSVAGFYGGKVDMFIMRIMEILDGVPSFLMALVITAAFGGSVGTLVVALAVGALAGQVRMIRGAVLTVRNNEYVEAARAQGATNWQIIYYHIIPNCIATIIVQFSIKVASGILNASALSFLGLGIQPPVPEWGAMLSGGRAYMLDNPYLTLFPGLCIMLVILAFNMLGDGLRDALDPRLKE